jgi:DNA-3-methyladenine glycosylase II
MPGRSALNSSQDEATIAFYGGEQARDHLQQADPVLGKLIRKVGPFTLRPDRPAHPFQSLATSILYQQLNGKAASTIVRRFVEAHGEKGRFPKPERVAKATAEALRACGISANKGLALQDLARRTLLGEVPQFRALAKMEDGAIVERLTAVRGIGPWTVEMLLLFRMGRPDVFPVTDFGVRKGFAIAFGRKELPSPKELMAHGERWRPYRSMASWYLWRATDLAAAAGETWP